MGYVIQSHSDQCIQVTDAIMISQFLGFFWEDFDEWKTNTALPYPNIAGCYIDQNVPQFSVQYTVPLLQLDILYGTF